MNRSLTLVALCGIATSALAAPPHPTAIDADGDKALAATVDVNGDGSKDYIDIGVRSKDYDCDDAHATVSPKLTEIVGDGIDNDCSGADAVYPVADAVAKRYLANSGTAGPVQFIAEYRVCSASIQCEVDDVAGTFKIKPEFEDTHRFVDVFVKDSVTLRNHGQKADGREVVTNEQYEHFRGSGGSASGSGTGVGKTYVDKSAEVLRKETGALREEMLKADSDADRRLDTIETGNTGRDNELNRLAAVDTVLEGRIAANEQAIADEAATRASEDERIEGIANSAVIRVNSIASHGSLFEAGAIGGGISHRPLETSGGDEIRGGVIGGGGFELRAGVDAEDWQTAGFGQFSFGSDGQGTGSDTGLLIGADVLIDAGSVELGPFVAYLRSEDHVNLLDVSVIENGGLVGITLQGDSARDSATRVVPFARLGVGVGYYGTRGSNQNGSTVVSNYGGLGLAQVGVRFGAGALED